MRLALLTLAFVVFTGATLGVVATEGLFGFLTLTPRAWGIQVLTDLGIALTLVLTWLVPDARKRGIPGWAYVVATVGLGSIAVLAYLVHREVHDRRTAVASAS